MYFVFKKKKTKIIDSCIQKREEKNKKLWLNIKSSYYVVFVESIYCLFCGYQKSKNRLKYKNII